MGQLLSTAGVLSYSHVHDPSTASSLVDTVYFEILCITRFGMHSIRDGPVTCCLPTMPVRYTALPNPGSTPDTTCEMEEAFASDEEHDGHDASESTPLTQGVDSAPAESSLSSHQSAAIPTYDFERSYDFPPPGSPPGPSSRALPNDFGNSNGLLPTSPIVRPQPKPSLFRRIMGAVVPSQYMPLATDSNTRPTGGGLENDGVFANVVAKPQPARTILSDNGDIHIVPEETQKDAPPVSFIFEKFLASLH